MSNQYSIDSKFVPVITNKFKSNIIKVLDLTLAEHRMIASRSICHNIRDSVRYFSKCRQNSRLPLINCFFDFILKNRRLIIHCPSEIRGTSIVPVKSSEDIRTGLQTNIFGRKIFFFDLIDSTNSCAKLLAESGVEEGTIVYAEEQSSGRGRLKRRWISQKGANLLFSIIFAPQLTERKYYLIPLMVSVSILEGIRRVVPDSPVEVKWPNDILLVSGHKIGGILTELTHTYDDELRIVVGVGLNVNQTEFPPSLRNTASSLKKVTGREVDRKALLHSILSAIEAKYGHVTSHPQVIIEEWRAHCSMFGKLVNVTHGSEEITGICRDIDEDGSLIVVDEHKGVRKILAGDVSSVSINHT